MRPKPEHSIFHPDRRLLTIALVTLVTIGAFDQTAIMAVMPAITESLGVNGTEGAGYTLTFTAVTASSVVSMVVGAIFIDTRGALVTLRTVTVIFFVGLVLAVFSPNLLVFLLSRVLQGIGGGAILVAVYALVALRYPGGAQPQMFAAFAGAWVLPTLVGPGLAGVITEHLGWHYIFVITGLISVAVWPMLWSVKPLGPRREVAPDAANSAIADVPARTKVIRALALGVAGIPVSLASSTGWWGLGLFAVGVALAAWAAAPLLPAGTLRVAPGLPAIVLLRFIFDGFFALEAIIPLMLAEVYHLAPTMTGLALTGTGVMWFVGAQVQASTKRFTTPAILVFSAVVMIIASVGVAVSVLVVAHWGWIVGFWTITGFGVGYTYPRVNTTSVQLTPDGQEGFVGSALSLSSQTGMTVVLAAGTMLLHLSHWSLPTNFAVVFFALNLIPVWILFRLPRYRGLSVDQPGYVAV